jgi:hypothetical protein
LFQEGLLLDMPELRRVLAAAVEGHLTRGMNLSSSFGECHPESLLQSPQEDRPRTI